MALRNIFKDGEPVLRRRCHPVVRFDDRLHQLLGDMADTMYDADGVGLAAPQVGILRRAVVIDVGEGIVELLNPVITEQSEETVCDQEGCLSFPGEYGMVPRPARVVCEYQDRFGAPQRVEAEGLFARAICHECDHLDGRVFKDIAERMIDPEELGAEEE